MSTRKMQGILIAVVTSLFLFQTSPGFSNELPVGELSAEMDATPSADHLVTNIVPDVPTPNILGHGQRVSFTFDYNTTEAGGVRIFSLPYTSTGPAKNFGVNGSPLYSVGTGTGSGYFTIYTGRVTIKKIRFDITNADQSVRLFRGFIPVNYQYK